MKAECTVLDIDSNMLGAMVPVAASPSRMMSNRGELSRDHWRSDRLLSLDQCRLLVHRLFLSDGAAKSVVFSGLEAKSGCTSVVFAAAETLSVSTDKSVCVVDANAYSPRLGSLYDLSSVKGLSDALIEERPVNDYISCLEDSNLWVLPYGAKAALEVEKKGGCFWIRDTISQLKSRFDYVLVDAPPASQYSDAITLGSAAGGIALVIQSGKARRDVAGRTTAGLRKADLRMLGVVVTSGPKQGGTRAESRH